MDPVHLRRGRRQLVDKGCVLAVLPDSGFVWQVLHPPFPSAPFRRAAATFSLSATVSLSTTAAISATAVAPAIAAFTTAVAPTAALDAVLAVRGRRARPVCSGWLRVPGGWTVYS